MATDSATYNSFSGTIVITKQLAAASANNLATSQTPTSGTPLTLNGSAVTGGVGVLDTQRRVLLTFGDEASARTLVLTGTNSQGTTIGETLSIPAGGSSTVASLRDYLTITKALPLGGGWTAAVTLGTNGVGSTSPQLPSGYPAIFDIGFQVTPGSGNSVSIEITRDIPYAPPQPYVSGFTFVPPICDWDAWATLSELSLETISDVDSRVTAWRLTILSGTSLCTVRAAPIGLRT